MRRICEGCKKSFDNKRVARGRFCSKRCCADASPKMPLALAIARFWGKVEKTDGCWPWKAGRSADGYGVARWEGKMKNAHRISWLLAHGEISSPGLQVLHKCDNPPCVRPDHLWLGDKTDNIQDMYERGRSRFNKPPRPRMTVEKVAEIRRLHSEGIVPKEIARQYGLSLASISKIVNGLAWVKGGGSHGE